MLWLPVAFVFAHVYWVLHRFVGINLPGLGWLMRRIGKDLVLDVHGIKTFMYHPIAGSNAMHIIGKWNEPETHWFLNAMLAGHEGGITFIDVGANIGEMAIDLSRNRAVSKVVAFEPVPACFHSLTVSSVINKVDNLFLRPCAVSDTIGVVQFTTSSTNPSSSGIAGMGNLQIEVPTTTLDEEFPEALHEPIVLLDIEGAEYAALKGGRELLKRDSPLIIFEYNDVSRRNFTLDEMRALLGAEYEIYRLRTVDGKLDQQFDDTWNCVAVHIGTRYYERCLKLIIS